jgi:hypothetical protein
MSCGMHLLRHCYRCFQQIGSAVQMRENKDRESPACSLSLKPHQANKCNEVRCPSPAPPKTPHWDHEVVRTDFWHKKIPTQPDKTAPLERPPFCYCLDSCGVARSAGKIPFLHSLSRSESCVLSATCRLLFSRRCFSLFPPFFFLPPWPACTCLPACYLGQALVYLSANRICPSLCEPRHDSSVASASQLCCMLHAYHCQGSR